MKNILCFILISSFINSAYSIDFEKQLKVYSEAEQAKFSEDIADIILQKIKIKPSASIVLPIGNSSVGVYRALIKKYKEDESIDLSKANWILPGEYEEFTPQNPLSARHFINIHFNDKLQKHDSLRAPRQYILPPLGSKLIDLAIIEVGPAYPAQLDNGDTTLIGGAIAFIEPNTLEEGETSHVILSENYKNSLKHKLRSLTKLKREGMFKGVQEFLPQEAITLAIRDLSKANELIMIAVGEDKAPILQTISNGEQNPKFPVSYLLNHPKLTFFVDDNAVSTLDLVPWKTTYKGISPRNYFNVALCDLTKHKSMKELHEDDFITLSYPKDELSAMTFKIEAFQNDLIQCLDEANVPYNKKILIISPHPDDDVISMAGTIKKLLQARNKVTVLYAVGGSNAIRQDDPGYLKILQKGDADLQRAKEIVREQEAAAAARILGLGPDNLIYFRAEYYDRRGIPEINPLSENDINRMEAVLLEKQPDYIYFAAENDPHGAHGLSTELVAEAVKRIGNLDITFLGYRGAYNEWPLYDPSSITITPLTQEDLELKIEAIKAHRSQLNPLYPSADKREFFERARDRNQQTAKHLNHLLDTNDIYAVEVFKEFSTDQFINLYSLKDSFSPY